MTTYDPFIKVGLKQNEVRITDRTGQVILRAVGTNGRDAIRRMRKVIEGRIDDLKHPVSNDEPG